MVTDMNMDIGWKVPVMRQANRWNYNCEGLLNSDSVVNYADFSYFRFLARVTVVCGQNHSIPRSLRSTVMLGRHQLHGLGK